MTPLPFAFSTSEWMLAHWFRPARFALGAALLLFAFLLRQSSRHRAYLLGAPGAAFALLALGGLLIPWGDSPFLRSIAGLLFVAAVLVLVVVAALLFISGAWYRPLAYGAPAAALF